MNKRQVRKKAYRSIIKGNKTHQMTYDNLKQQRGDLTREEVAEEISKIPSRKRINTLKTLRYTFLSVMILIGLIRLLALFSLIEGLDELWILLITVLISLAVPVIGVLAVFYNHATLYRAAGGLLIYSIYKSVTNSSFTFDTTFLIALIPIVAGVILAFYIPFKLKTPYQVISKKGEDGKTRTRYLFQQEEKPTQPDLLDG
tara:strand:- start:56645 stop:57247 length:603 start_codon:yes stop_codon:yes gene_type:complete